MSNIKPIDAVMWAVVDKEGKIDKHSIRANHPHCFADFKKETGMSDREFTKNGYACQQVRVRIEPIKQE